MATFAQDLATSFALDMYGSSALEWEEVNIYNKERFPNFVGVEKNGSCCDFRFDYDNKEKGKFDFDILRIFANKKIVGIAVDYNERNEEWENTIVKTYGKEEKEELVGKLEIMLRCYPIANRNGLFINNFKDLIKALK